MPHPKVHAAIQHGSGHPYLRFAEQRNIRRKDTHDGQGRPIHPDGAADDVAIAAEIALPNCIAEYRNLGQIDLLIREHKIASQRGTNTETLKETGGCNIAKNLFWFIARKI